MYPKFNLKKRPVGFVAQAKLRLEQAIESERQRTQRKRFSKAYKIQSLEAEYLNLVNINTPHSPISKFSQSNITTVFLPSAQKQRREKSVNETNTDNNSNSDSMNKPIFAGTSARKVKLPLNLNDPSVSSCGNVTHKTKKGTESVGRRRVSQYSQSVKTGYFPKINMNKSLELIMLIEKRHHLKPPILKRVHLSTLIK